MILKAIYDSVRANPKALPFQVFDTKEKNRACHIVGDGENDTGSIRIYVCYCNSAKKVGSLGLYNAHPPCDRQHKLCGGYLSTALRFVMAAPLTNAATLTGQLESPGTLDTTPKKAPKGPHRCACDWHKQILPYGCNCNGL